MRTVTTKPELLQPPADSSSGLFDDWFDPIEVKQPLSEIRGNENGEAMEI